MTILDKVMVIYYAIMANSIISLAIQMKIHVSDLDAELKQVRIRKINKLMLYCVPVIIGILVGLLFIP